MLRSELLTGLHIKVKLVLALLLDHLSELLLHIVMGSVMSMPLTGMAILHLLVDEVIYSFFDTHRS